LALKQRLCVPLILDALPPQLTTVDANAQESKEVAFPHRFCV
jgi:hypothetical protein